MHIRTHAWMQPCTQTLHSWLRGMQHSMLPQVATSTYAHMHGCNHALDHTHALMAQRHAAQHAPASSHESSACTYAHMHGCNHALRHCTHGSESYSPACSLKSPPEHTHTCT